jgi:enediyne biosynthesis protein E4
MRLRRFVACALSACVASYAVSGQTPPARSLPTFKDIVATSGVDFRLDSGNSLRWFILEGISAGVLMIDYDNDGWPDLYFVNGSTIEQLDAGQKSRGNRLYRNNRNGTFTDVTQKAGVGGTGAWGMGGCVGDVDNNGFDDIFVTNYGPDVLYLNNGNGTFRDASATAGVQGGERWHTGCAFGDYDRDGDLDLYVANYVRFSLSEARSKPPYSTTARAGQAMAQPGPQMYDPVAHEFYENTGSGRFVDASERTGLGRGGSPTYRPGGLHAYGLGVVWGDYDNDGDLDLFVANDMTPNFLFRNNGDKSFTEVGSEAGVAFDGNGRVQAGMGVDMADVNNDGLLDIVVTNFADDHTTLYRNSGGPRFTDVSSRVGLLAGPFMGWGVQFADFDLDGRLDMLNVNGHVSPLPALEARRSLLAGFLQRPLIYQQQPDGVLKELGSSLGGPFAEARGGRGLAVGDLNNDGQLDFVVNNQEDRPTIAINQKARGNWFEIKLIGTRSNRSAVGARVTVRTGAVRQMREVKSGGSYLSQSDLRLHFGLGDAARIDELSVRWPSGLVETRQSLPANQIVTLREQ